MKICFIGPAYPYKGGIASFNERLATELISMGHQVDILTFTLQYPSFLYPGKTQYSDAPAPNLNIRRGINSINPITWLREGARYRKKDYDLIISRFWLPVIGPSLGTTIRRITKNKATKSLAIVDNIIPHEKRPGDKLLTQYFVNSVNGFLVMSHKVEEDLKQFVDNQPVKYAPHPIYDNYGERLSRDEALNFLKLPADKDYVLFFGFIRDYKGLDLLMESFKIASLKNPKLRLVVAGEYYSDSAKYTELINQLDIEDKVHLFTDFIPNDEVKYFFSMADIVAQTYKSATQSGISQLAIHFEKPILSTDVGGLPETTIDGKTGHICPVDKEAIAEKLTLHFGASDKERFRAEIIKFKEQFSWERFANTIMDLVAEVSNNNIQ